VSVAGFTGTVVRKPPGKEPAGDEAGGPLAMGSAARAEGTVATDTMFAVGIEVAAVIEGGFDRVAGVEGWPRSRPMPDRLTRTRLCGGRSASS
jgi:hypothetical protein